MSDRKSPLLRRIAKQRAKLKLSQRDVAEKAGVDQSYVQRVESGQVDPSLTKAKALCDALDLELADLFA